MKTRKATTKDLDAVSAIYAELFLAMAKIQPHIFRSTEQNRAFMESTINNSSADMIVAEIDGKITGFALVMEQTPPPYSCFVQQTYALLMDLAVSKQYQGQGIGSALLDAAKVWTQKKGLDYLELNVLAGNERAQKLYEKEGFKEQIVNMGVHL